MTDLLDPSQFPPHLQVTVPDMMQARESRFLTQQALLTRHPGSVLVCLCMNIAGPVKSTPQILRAFDWGLSRVRAVLAPLTVFDALEHRAVTGPEAIFCVRGDARVLKQRLCALEDGLPLGRLLDIDVLDASGSKYARTDIGLPPRRCLLCGREAPACARSRTHSVAELFARSHALIREHFEDAFARSVAADAQRALLTEVAVTPKPGLVDRADSGAHDDMDFFTFINSACVLPAYFEQCVRIGLAHRGPQPDAPMRCFDALRTPGLLAEADMLRATGGVNTHKGAIFSLGIFCAALGLTYRDDVPADAVLALNTCGQMTAARMQAELSDSLSESGGTAGRRLYRSCGAGGVREEAASGFASVSLHALPALDDALDAGLSLNDAALCALVALMACTQDTNALHRGGEDGARRMREEAAALHGQIKTAIRSGRVSELSLTKRMADWNLRLSARRISPGGCADLLAMALLAHFVRQP